MLPTFASERPNQELHTRKTSTNTTGTSRMDLENPSSLNSPLNSSPNFTSNSNNSNRTFKQKVFAIFKLFSSILVAIVVLRLIIHYVEFVSFSNSSVRKEQIRIYEEISKLLTNPDQTKEGSYGWYRKKLDNNNQLGNTKFKDPIMTKLGFQETHTTSAELFPYFRTVNTDDVCKKQHSCRFYADKTAGEFLEEGVQLDAVLQHCQYKDPFFLNSEKDEAKLVNELQFHVMNSNMNLKNEKLIGDEKALLHHIHQMDNLFGEKIWRGMRRLSIIMCSEARVHELVGGITQKADSYWSKQRFASSTADISLCFLSTCSVWINYHYQDMYLSKSKVFGSKPFSKNKGICAFISNCDQAGCTDLKQRFELLNTLSKYIPVRQYGKCGKNAQEGPGGKTFEIENNCRFYYAAENSIANDYVTEKFFEGLRALEHGSKVLMLYRGAPNLRQDWGIPNTFFLDHNDFESVDALGQHLKKLNEDDNAFEQWFSKITMQERKKLDKALAAFNPRLGSNIPCRICSIIGEMKLSRYLLFKIGLKTDRPKVNMNEWNDFKSRFNLSAERLKILDDIYHTAYGIFQSENNKENRFNLGWDFNKQ